MIFDNMFASHWRNLMNDLKNSWNYYKKRADHYS